MLHFFFALTNCTPLKCSWLFHHPRCLQTSCFTGRN